MKLTNILRATMMNLQIVVVIVKIALMKILNANSVHNSNYNT